MTRKDYQIIADIMIESLMSYSSDGASTSDYNKIKDILLANCNFFLKNTGNFDYEKFLNYLEKMGV